VENFGSGFGVGFGFGEEVIVGISSDSVTVCDSYGFNFEL
jgi:hypothetical protein